MNFSSMPQATPSNAMSWERLSRSVDGSRSLSTSERQALARWLVASITLARVLAAQGEASGALQTRLYSDIATLVSRALALATGTDQAQRAAAMRALFDDLDDETREGRRAAFAEILALSGGSAREEYDGGARIPDVDVPGGAASTPSSFPVGLALIGTGALLLFARGRRR